MVCQKFFDGKLMSSKCVLPTAEGSWRGSEIQLSSASAACAVSVPGLDRFPDEPLPHAHNTHTPITTPDQLLPNRVLPTF